MSILNITSAISLSFFRKKLADTMDSVEKNHTPILITRQGRKGVVIISEEDYRSHIETMYLIASPKNAERLNKSIATINAGKAKQHKLIDL